MTLPRTLFRDFLAVPPICLLVLCFASVELRAQGDQPPAEPPADWGPISINMEEIEYPHPVHFLNLNLYGQDVRIAYMDVPPVGPPSGRTVVFLHGGSYYGWYWKEQIEALRNEGFRVIVKDRLGWGKSSKPILPYQHQPARLEHGTGPRAPGDLRSGGRGSFDRGADGHPFRLSLPADDDAPRPGQCRRSHGQPGGPWLPPDERGDRGGCGSSGGLRIRRANRSAPLCELETAVHGNTSAFAMDRP